MAPTSDLELRQYLNSKGIPCSEVEVLTGGTANYVWRIRTLLGRSSIVKHAEPYVKVNRIFPFPVIRMDFEVKALSELPGVLERSEEDMNKDSEFLHPEKAGSYFRDFLLEIDINKFLAIWLTDSRKELFCQH